MRKTIVLVVAVAIAVVAFMRWRGRIRVQEQAPLEAARAQATAPAPDRPSGSAVPAVTGVRKLSVDDRRALRSQIDRALHQRAETSASAPSTTGSAPALDDIPTIPLDKVGKQAQDALKSAIPMLAECYPQGTTAAKTALAQMVAISDPDLGMVIDTSAITAADGAPIAPSLDDCLRNTIESLALPPLAVPGKLPLQYSFRFD